MFLTELYLFRSRFQLHCSFKKLVVLLYGYLNKLAATCYCVALVAPSVIGVVFTLKTLVRRYLPIEVIDG